MVLTFENLYHIIALALTCLFSMYILFSKVKEQFGNIYIGLFILFSGFGNLDVLLPQINFYRNYPNTWLILASTSFLVFPLMYFYIKSIAFRSQKIRWVDTIHLLPFIIFISLCIYHYHSKSLDTKLYLMNTADSSLFDFFIPATYVMLHIQALIYIILSILTVKKFKQIVKENYSSYNKRSYKWIFQLNFVFVYFIITAFVHNYLRFFVDVSLLKTMIYFTGPINIIFLIWIIYKAMSQPYLFNGVDANLKLLQEYISEKEHEKQTQEKRISSDDVDLQNTDLKSRLDLYMKEEEVFLNPSLTIFDLANGLDMSSIELSLFLNKELHKNFFDYINEYRIDKAKKLLIDPDKKDLTVLEILYEVGFNSKSSFNTAFKKFTNKTPTQYRKSLIM